MIFLQQLLTFSYFLLDNSGEDGVSCHSECRRPPRRHNKSSGMCSLQKEIKVCGKEECLCTIVIAMKQTNKTGSFVGKLFLDSSNILFNFHLLETVYFWSVHF